LGSESDAVRAGLGGLADSDRESVKTMATDVARGRGYADSSTQLGRVQSSQPLGAPPAVSCAIPGALPGYRL